MTSYTITVYNKSGYEKNYVYFMAPPLVSATGGQPEIFTNAWITFSGIKNGSFDSVTYHDSTYAYWATSDLSVEPGTVLRQGGVADVDTSRRDGVTFTGNSSSTGFSLVTSGKARSGSFQIESQSDFTRSNNYLFGLARPGNVPGLPSPVATFVAQPNEIYDITPVVKFYLADGDYTDGQIIDVSKVSKKNCEINFTGKAQQNVIVTQKDDGSFMTKYY